MIRRLPFSLLASRLFGTLLPLVLLMGGGECLAQGVAFSPTSLTFASRTVGTSSGPQTVTMTNTGTASFPLSSIGITGADTGEFFETNNCPSPLSAGASCSINVTFAPSATGARTAGVAAVERNGAGTFTVPLSGTGVAAGGTISFSPTSLTFGSQTVGTSSGPQSVTMTNSGSASFSLSSIAITGTNTGEFFETNNCPSPVAVGARCSINVTFRPAATGTRTAGAAAVQNGGSTFTVPLSGIGIGSGAAISFNPTSLSFASLAVGASSAPQTVTMTNSGSTSFSLSGIAITGADPGDFSETNNCPSPLAATASCSAYVTFAPKAGGVRTGGLTALANGGVGFTDPLSGTGGTGGTSGGGGQALSAAFFGMQISSSSDWPGPPTIIGSLGKCAGATWPWIESSRGVYNWSNLDVCLSMAETHGVSLLYSSDCGSNSSPAGCSGGSAPAGLGIPSWTTCQNLASDYAGFFTAFLTRYGTRIPIIELWNEPGGVGCTTAQFVAATNAAYNVIRSLEPSITILSPSFVCCSTYYLGLIQNYYAAGGTQSVDGWSMHFHTFADSPPLPESLVNDLDEESATLAAIAPTVLRKSLWNTEGGAYFGPYGFPTSTLMAAYIARYHLLTWAVGVTRDYWEDWDTDGTIMGTAAAVTAYDQVEKWMIGSSNPALSSSGTVYTVSMVQTSNNAQAVWNTAGSSTYSVPAGYGHYQDLSGNTYAVASGAVTIGVQPILLIP